MIPVRSTLLRGSVTSIAVLTASAALLAACSPGATVAARHPAAATSPYMIAANAGIIQLRPVIPPKGAISPSCPVGESLGTCTATFNFLSWKRPASRCQKSADATNPAPTQPANLPYVGRTASACFDLAPATYVLTTAASVNTNLQPLNGNPGIEITVPHADAPTLDAALAKPFKQPLAIVADGQIVEILDVQPTSATYQPMGGVLIFYGASAEIQRIAERLRLESGALPSE